MAAMNPYEEARKRRMRDLPRPQGNPAQPKAQQANPAQPSSNVRVGTGAGQALGGSTRGRAVFSARRPQPQGAPQPQPMPQPPPQQPPDWWQAQGGNVQGAAGSGQGPVTAQQGQQGGFGGQVGGVGRMPQVQQQQATPGPTAMGLVSGLPQFGGSVNPANPNLTVDLEDYTGSIPDVFTGEYLPEEAPPSEPAPSDLSEATTAWALDQFGGVRDTSEDEALLQALAQGALGQDLVNARAGMAARGFGASGALGALEGDLIRQAGLEAGREIMGLRDAARAEELARAQAGAGIGFTERDLGIREDVAAFARAMLEEQLGDEDLPDEMLGGSGVGGTPASIEEAQEMARESGLGNTFQGLQDMILNAVGVPSPADAQGAPNPGDEPAFPGSEAIYTDPVTGETYNLYDSAPGESGGLYWVKVG